jgi:hypothetical protein
VTVIAVPVIEQFRTNRTKRTLSGGCLAKSAGPDMPDRTDTTSKRCLYGSVSVRTCWCLASPFRREKRSITIRDRAG